MAIAIAALVGGVGQVAVQWRPLRREGFAYEPFLNWRDPGLRQVLLLMGPGTIGLAATQVNIFVNTLLATSQGTGAVSWLTYAFRLMYLPIGLFGVSIGTAVLPAVSRHAAIDDVDGVRATVSRGHRDDVDAQRAGDVRPAGAGHADRPVAVRARTLPAGRHDADGGGAALLCARSRRLLDRPHRIAHVLRAPSQPRAGRRQRLHDRGERHLERGARAGDGIPRACARHLGRGARQRPAARVAAAQAC